jgi:hypothetical protein
MPADTGDQGAPAKFKNVRASDFRSIYSNNAAFQVGVFDFSIFFGEVMGVDESSQTLMIEQRVKIIMSPLHAKIFINTALQQLNALEERFGEIKIPPGVIAESANAGGPDNE